MSQVKPQSFGETLGQIHTMLTDLFRRQGTVNVKTSERLDSLEMRIKRVEAMANQEAFNLHDALREITEEQTKESPNS